MSAQHESPAVAIARAHVEAWSNHDFDTARNGLAPDVRVTATTTQPMPPPTDLTGADDYMIGLKQFAQAVVPGSLRIVASTGDERNALLMLTVEADFGAGKATLPGARLYLLDDDNKIKIEQVVFYAAQG
ncbi:MAG TPA: nuclear transport factor 2 family protein [Streptosporangiaceae bacterium]|nr:nuclear transport factor 2 family protein [Streptosporangiaceae bacterium]